MLTQSFRIKKCKKVEACHVNRSLTHDHYGGQVSINSTENLKLKKVKKKVKMISFKYKKKRRQPEFAPSGVIFRPWYYQADRIRFTLDLLREKEPGQ